ncbi:MAG: hypothetical protein LBP87_15350, partial [Planctomycetaceae bacterium]|nr:hypothetical protein [Planctomycetaceae bacterium]
MFSSGSPTESLPFYYEIIPTLNRFWSDDGMVISIILISLAIILVSIIVTFLIIRRIYKSKNNMSKHTEYHPTPELKKPEPVRLEKTGNDPITS